jgi:hypothetical protein
LRVELLLDFSHQRKSWRLRPPDIDRSLQMGWRAENYPMTPLRSSFVAELCERLDCRVIAIQGYPDYSHQSIADYLRMKACWRPGMDRLDELRRG